MKRIALMLLIAVAATVTALAANPRLACESLFSEKYRSNPQATVSIINSTGNYFRGISVANDPSLVKEIEKKLEEDRKLATNTVEEYSAGNKYDIVLNIPLGGKIISVGYTRNGDGSAELFVSGPPEAFR
ncbi:MAG: hypothetical protein K1V88_05540 [Muribaculaceae bacterium]